MSPHERVINRRFHLPPQRALDSLPSHETGSKVSRARGPAVVWDKAKASPHVAHGKVEQQRASVPSFEDDSQVFREQGVFWSGTVVD